MFITAFRSARHLFLSWASSIQSMSPHPTSWRSLLILSSLISGISYKVRRSMFAGNIRDDIGSRKGRLNMTLRLYPVFCDSSNFDLSKIRLLCSCLFTCPTSSLWFIIAPWMRYFLNVPEIKKLYQTVIRDSRKSVPAVADRLYLLYKLGKGLFWREKNRPITAIRGFPLWAQSGNFWLRPPTFISCHCLYHVSHSRVLSTPLIFLLTEDPRPINFSHQYVL
jgi:hypothetical protein